MRKLSEDSWTQDPPTVPGLFWWWSGDMAESPVPIEFEHNRDGLLVICDQSQTPGCELDGYGWWDPRPLRPPELPVLDEELPQEGEETLEEKGRYE